MVFPGAVLEQRSSYAEFRAVGRHYALSTDAWQRDSARREPPARCVLVAEGGKAMRYGVGIGRDGFTWSGRGEIRLKREWPTWTPPSEMIVRQPELEPYRNGMAPGLDNPLGARALYIFQDGRDTLYRVHGTSDPTTIGLAVSSGCVRLINQDVIDLYSRVSVGSAIVVQQTA